MLVAVCAFTSCSWIQKITGSEDPVKNAYSSLYATGSVYNMGMNSVSMLQKQGTITSAQREGLNKAAYAFRVAYYSSVDALGMWKMNVGTPNEGELKTILQNLLFGLAQNWTALQQAINAFSPGLIQGDIQLSVTKKVAVDSQNNPALKSKGVKDPKKLDPALVPIIIAVVGLIVQYGIPEAMKLMEAMKKTQISLDDIKALKELVKDPTTY